LSEQAHRPFKMRRGPVLTVLCPLPEFTAFLLYGFRFYSYDSMIAALTPRKKLHGLHHAARRSFTGTVVTYGLTR
jgi:hypothetical protein